MSCENGHPLGVGTTSRAVWPSAAGMISSSASPQTSGFITMPGPPPNGTSSTVWWTSLAQRRRSCTPNSMSPRTAAFPISETPSGLPKYSGKIVTMSMRSAFFRPTPAPSIPIRLLRLGVVKQSGRRIDDHDAGPEIDLGHDRLHERDQHLARVPAHRGHRQALPAGAILKVGVVGSAPGVEGGAHSEPEVRLVRPDPDHDLAADPVRTANPADDYPHRISGSRWRPAGRSGRSGHPPGRRSRYAAPGRCARPSR